MSHVIASPHDLRPATWFQAVAVAASRVSRLASRVSISEAPRPAGAAGPPGAPGGRWPTLRARRRRRRTATAARRRGTAQRTGGRHAARLARPPAVLPPPAAETQTAPAQYVHAHVHVRRGHGRRDGPVCLCFVFCWADVRERLTRLSALAPDVLVLKQFDHYALTPPLSTAPSSTPLASPCPALPRPACLPAACGACS